MERHKPRTRVVVLVPDRRERIVPAHQRTTTAAVQAPRGIEDRYEEALGLARAIDLDIVHSAIVPLPAPKPGTLFGSGKVEEIAAKVKELEAGLVIIDHAVSPIQQRNLERAWDSKVLDRTGLILEIFGERAATREGRLQVELAHLTYQKGRLVRTWTHLERQRGGFGFLGGPGEAQIELDRRMIEERIEKIQRDLARVVRTRALHRSGRNRVPFPVVAIVGYTNAGKSTLFNRLTGASVLAKDQVFATLDPTMREIKLASGRRVILSDTVGFISDLPTALVAAFRATLEEVVAADLILHVRDISHPETEAQKTDVESVLADLGIDANAAETPLLEVWNKCDLLSSAALLEARRAILRSGRGEIMISALDGMGFDALLAGIDARLGGADEILEIDLPPREGRLLSWLHDNSEVLSQDGDDEGNLALRVRIDATLRGKLEGLLKRAELTARAPVLKRRARRRGPRQASG